MNATVMPRAAEAIPKASFDLKPIFLLLAVLAVSLPLVGSPSTWLKSSSATRRTVCAVSNCCPRAVPERVMFSAPRRKPISITPSTSRMPTLTIISIRVKPLREMRILNCELRIEVSPNSQFETRNSQLSLIDSLRAGLRG